MNFYCIKFRVTKCTEFSTRYTLFTNKMVHLIKSKYNIVKTTNSTRAYPLVVIDANLIGYKALAGIDATKYTEIIASIFLVAVLVCQSILIILLNAIILKEIGTAKKELI